jgi:hypothetical protein
MKSSEMKRNEMKEGRKEAMNDLWRSESVSDPGSEWVQEWVMEWMNYQWSNAWANERTGHPVYKKLIVWRKWWMNAFLRGPMNESVNEMLKGSMNGWRTKEWTEKWMSELLLCLATPWLSHLSAEAPLLSATSLSQQLLIWATSFLTCFYFEMPPLVYAPRNARPAQCG